MPPIKPAKTPADYLVVCISPVLIMLLVGSLSFFLIEVFFRGEAAGSVRWVLFWFVMAVVLVSRIGIEQGAGPAAVYGLALAVATWLYLVRIHPAFMLGAILLGVVWWCAHKLTWDCTLIAEDEDASGSGLLQTAGQRNKFLPPNKSAAKWRGAKSERKPPPPKPHPPGLWVVWFSLAALPLFGIGQMLLPSDDLAARHAGFKFLFVYVAAALGLLLTTSFLGLRRYLRQRYLPMPPMIALGWIRFGVGVAVFVLAGALLLPRPGANDAWQALRYQIDYRLRHASEYAARFGPHGSGPGRSGEETQQNDSTKNPAAAQSRENSGPSPSPGQIGTVHDQNAPPQPLITERAGQFYRGFKILFLLALAALAGWWLFRRRELIFQIARSFAAALAGFFKDLFGFLSPRPESAAPAKIKPPDSRRFASYRNPFLAGKDASWTHEQLVFYSFEALQVWAEEQGVNPRPEQTAREFCVELGGRFPEIISELNQMSFLYSHAAYGTSMQTGSDWEPIKRLWRFLCS